MLKIINATWGYHGYWVDVAHILTAAIAANPAGNLIIIVNPATLTPNGDPLYWWVKELNVIYEFNGIKHQIMIQEKCGNPPITLTITEGIATTTPNGRGLLTISGLIP